MNDCCQDCCIQFFGGCPNKEKVKKPSPPLDKCDLCPEPSTNTIIDMDGIIVSELCDDCYRRVNKREPRRRSV